MSCQREHVKQPVFILDEGVSQDFLQTTRRKWALRNIFYVLGRRLKYTVQYGCPSTFMA